MLNSPHSSVFRSFKSSVFWHNTRHSALLVALCLLAYQPRILLSAPDAELAYKLKASIVKVHVNTKTGGRGLGSGVVVAPDIVATNCHILANANSVNISKFGNVIAPDSVQADWIHDVCLLKFQYLELTPVKLSTSNQLLYGQEVFSIGFPGGVIKPITSFGTIHALYPIENAMMIRTDASFLQGASGSPLFDQQGALIGLSTFKSPGKNAFFYHVPVEWVQNLLNQPNIKQDINETPFWDAPLERRPFFMQVVLPYKNAKWHDLEDIAKRWIQQDQQQAEAHFYLASALHGQNQLEPAKQTYQQCLKLQAKHIDAWLGLGVLAHQIRDPDLLTQVRVQLQTLNPDSERVLDEKLKALNL